MAKTTRFRPGSGRARRTPVVPPAALPAVSHIGAAVAARNAAARQAGVRMGQAIAARNELSRRAGLQQGAAAQALVDRTRARTIRASRVQRNKRRT